MTTINSAPGVADTSRPFVGAPAWKLEDAKARFSEVVRLARGVGPQYVTVRGEMAVVVVSVADFERGRPTDPARPAFLAFMEGLGLQDLDLARPRDTGRDLDL